MWLWFMEIFSFWKRKVGPTTVQTSSVKILQRVVSVFRQCFFLLLLYWKVALFLKSTSALSNHKYLVYLKNHENESSLHNLVTYLRSKMFNVKNKLPWCLSHFTVTLISAWCYLSLPWATSYSSLFRYFYCDVFLFKYLIVFLQNRHTALLS